jgi:hypothetical protein
MSARTLAQHTPDELTYHGLRGEVAVFSAPSASRPGQRNVIVRDAITGEFHCDCKAADTGKRCWHADWLETAWLMREVAPFVAALADDELAATAAAAKARLDEGTGTRTDLLTYYQCRAEWRGRGACPPSLSPVVALPVARVARMAVAA